MNERIFELREILGLSQEAFGNILGIKRAAVSLIETGKNKLTDSNIKLICTKFSVNEDWLRCGSGEMFIVLDSDEEFDALIGELLADEANGLDVGFKKEFITSLLKLDLDQWVLIKNFIDSFTKK